MTFEPGHKLAPGGARRGAGRKPDALKAQLRELLDQAVSEEAWTEIFETLALQAMDGDIKATTLLLDRKFGKAPQVIEIEEADGPLVDLTRLSEEDLGTIAALFRKAASSDGVPDAEPIRDRGGDSEAALPAGPSGVHRRGPRGRFVGKAD